MLDTGADVCNYDVLRYAISQKWTEGVVMLLRAGIYPKEGNLPQVSIPNPREESSETLLGNGVDLNKYNALGDAISPRWEEGLEILIEHGADPNKYNALGDAIRWKWAEGFEILLKHRSPQMSRNSTMTTTLYFYLRLAKNGLMG